MKKTGIILLALLLLCSSACGANQKYQNQDDKIILGFISESMTVERWQRDRDIFVAKAEGLGAEVIVKNAYEDNQRQIELGKEIVDQDADVLAIVPYAKDGLKELVQYAHSKNVEVISYDRLITDAGADLYISFDNERVGELMGDAAVAAVPMGNYVLLNGFMQDNNSYMLNDGYMGVLQPYVSSGWIKVVGEIWVENWRDELAYNYVSQLIHNGTHIDAIIAADDRLAEGAVNALSENRLAGEVFVTGQDAELAACQRIVQGTQSMTVYKPIRVLAEGAAEIAVKLAKGGDIGESDTISDGTYDMKYIVYEPILVNKDNIYDVVIQDGFYTVAQVYANVPENEWPQYSSTPEE